MKRLAYIAAAALSIMTMYPIGSACSQTLGKKSLPPVSITFPGDTDKTISRRAQWIEEARKEGALSWWGNLRPEEGNKVIAEFNKLYPFVTVEFVRQQSEGNAATLEAAFTAGKVNVDVLEGGGTLNYPRWRKIGMLEKFSEIIPGIEKIPKTMYSTYGDWAQVRNNATVPMYNTKLVSAGEAPKSWEDLLNPRWKGQIGMTADMRVWGVLALAENGWGIEKTEAFLKKLRQQQPIWAAGHTAGHQLMLSGEFKVMAEDFLYTCLESQRKGAPAEWIRVSGVPITGSSITLQKKAPHPYAARLFIEWVLSPQGRMAYEAAAQVGVIFPGAGTRQAKVLEGLPLLYRTEEMELKMIETGIMERFAGILGVQPGL